MATRFYFPSTGSVPITPAFDTAWNVVTGAVRLPLERNKLRTAPTTLTDFSITINAGATNNFLRAQFISEPLPAQTITGTISGVVRAIESIATVNANWAAVVYGVSQDGSIFRGYLLNAAVIDTEYVITTPSTVIEVATAVTTLSIQGGDRIIAEMGDHAVSPAAGSAIQRYGTSAASDFALTHALTTDLNPWIEFSQDLWAPMPNNYQSIKGGDGMSFGDRIR